MVGYRRNFVPGGTYFFTAALQDRTSSYLMLVKSGVPLVKNARGEYQLWQRCYWEHTIIDEQDLKAHIDYIHYNPVKHGYVDKASEWMSSSFHRFVRAGILSEDWGSSLNNLENMKFGE